MQMYKLNSGLTLLELVVVIALVAIVAFVSYASYRPYLIESRRIDAMNALRENHLIIESYIEVNGIVPESNEVTLKIISDAALYDIDFTKVSDTRYTLVATAIAGTTQEEDTGCTEITLTSEMDDIYPKECH